MELHYFWLLCQGAQKILDVSQHPGAENMGDCLSKAHTAPVCRHVRPYFINIKKLPLFLPLAPSPASQQGCSETLGDAYIRGLPLPRIHVSRELKPDNDQTVSIQPMTERTPRACLIRLLNGQTKITRAGLERHTCSTHNLCKIIVNKLIHSYT